MTDRKFLYISSVDISISNGPGVNEREFITTARRLIGENIHFIIPKPVNRFPDGIPTNACTFTVSHQLRNPFLWILHQLSIIYHAKKYLKSNRVDLIVMRAGLFAFALLNITKSSRIPYAVKTANDGRFLIFKKKGSLWSLPARLNSKIYGKLIKNALMVDAVSKMQVQSLKNLFGNTKKIVWIDNGVNTERFFPKSVIITREKLGLTGFNPIVGYAGNYAWERGGMQIIEILAHLILDYPGMGVLIMGGGEGLIKLKSKAKQLDVERNCIFTGQVPFDSVVDYINSMDICVSLLAPELQHASEQKVRQYLACGKPVIVSPGSNDFVKDEGLGYIVDPNDIDEITRRIDQILKLSDLERVEMAGKSVKYARNQLSYESKINKRLKLWSTKLDEQEMGRAKFDKKT